MKMSGKITEYSDTRRVGQQGACPPVLRQAGLDKYATGCGEMSLPSKHPIDDLKLKTTIIRTEKLLLEQTNFL